MPTILAVEDDDITSRLLKAVLIPNHYSLVLALNRHPSWHRTARLMLRL